MLYGICTVDVDHSGIYNSFVTGRALSSVSKKEITNVNIRYLVLSLKSRRTV